VNGASGCDEGADLVSQLGDARLPRITPDALRDALSGFPLELAGDREMQWLATGVRRSLAMSIRHVSEGPGRQSNADTRKELQQLSLRTGKLWAAIFDGLSEEADEAIWRYVLRKGDGAGWIEAGDGGDGLIWTAPLHGDYKEAVACLNWLSGFLQSVARDIPSQSPRWTQAEWRELRIRRGQWLAPIFEAAYGGGTATAFGDFYQRAVTLAFNEGDIPDFEAIISEVRKRHSVSPARFDPAYIPGL
jgi:hypothetical protein